MARPIGDGRVGLRLVRGSVGIRRGERWYRGRKGAKESMDVLGNGSDPPPIREAGRAGLGNTNPRVFVRRVCHWNIPI